MKNDFFWERAKNKKYIEGKLSGYTAIKSNEGWDRLAIAWQTSLLRRLDFQVLLKKKRKEKKHTINNSHNANYILLWIQLYTEKLHYFTNKTSF